MKCNNLIVCNLIQKPEWPGLGLSPLHNSFSFRPHVPFQLSEKYSDLDKLHNIMTTAAQCLYDHKHDFVIIVTNQIYNKLFVPSWKALTVVCQLGTCMQKAREVWSACSCRTDDRSPVQ